MAIEIAEGGIDVGILVRDADVMLGFYRDFLGLEVESTMDLAEAMGLTLHFLRVGTAHLKLVVSTDTPNAANPRGTMRDATGLRYLTLRVVSLDPLLDGLEAAGGGLTEPIMEFGPSRIALVHDPEGNVLEIIGA